MAVETDAQSHRRVLAGKQTEGDPLKELSGLAEGLEPSPATKEDLDDYEEVWSDLTKQKSLLKPFRCTSSRQYITPFPAIFVCEDISVRSQALSTCTWHILSVSMCPVLACTWIMRSAESASLTGCNALGSSCGTSIEVMLYLQLEVGNLDFLDTHQLRQRLSENASKVRSRVQQVNENMPPLLYCMQGHEHVPSFCCTMHAFTSAGWPDPHVDPHAWLT